MKLRGVGALAAPASAAATVMNDGSGGGGGRRRRKRRFQSGPDFLAVILLLLLLLLLLLPLVVEGYFPFLLRGAEFSQISVKPGKVLMAMFCDTPFPRQ